MRLRSTWSQLCVWSLIFVIGVGVLPAFAQDNSNKDKKEKPKKDVTVDGVEVRHPGHSADDMARLMALVEHFGLVPSGGSDWHGVPGPRTLGAMRVPMEWLHWQDERAKSRKVS